MLEIGNNYLTLDQEQTHFALWSIVKAPLIIGFDLDKVSQESFEIIKNKELIDINQDQLGQQGKCVLGCSYWDIFIGSPQVYAGPLSNGDVAVVIVNWGGSAKGSYEVDLSAVGIQQAQSVIVRDLWKH